MNALDLHHKGTRNPRSRDETSRRRYDRARGCLYFEFVWSQQVVPELYVVRTVRHPSWLQCLPADARDPKRFPRSGMPN
jgi:hypothetical protein